MGQSLTAHIDARNAEITAAWDAAPDKQLAIDPSHYLDVVLSERAQLYADHLKAMDIPPDMAIWAVAMARKFGPTVKVWHFVADNWITALMILMHGEEPRASHTSDGSAWPRAIDDRHRQRMTDLLAGKDWPAKAITILGA